MSIIHIYTYIEFYMPYSRFALKKCWLAQQLGCLWESQGNWPKEGCWFADPHDGTKHPMTPVLAWRLSQAIPAVPFKSTVIVVMFAQLFPSGSSDGSSKNLDLLKRLPKIHKSSSQQIDSPLFMGFPGKMTPNYPNHLCWKRTSLLRLPWNSSTSLPLATCHSSHRPWPGKDLTIKAPISEGLWW